MAPDATEHASLSSIVKTILDAGSITKDDVHELRGEVFQDGIVDRGEAEQLFMLNDACRDTHETWNDFYVEALTDYAIWRTAPEGYVSDDDAQWIIGCITHDGRIDSRSELELLVNIIHWAQHCPETLVLLALQAVKDSVLGGGGVLFGPARRRPGVIDRADVAILSRLVYGGGSGGGLTITRREADLFFDLNDAIRGRENAEEWRDLFVKVIASHLMFPRGVPHIPDADEMLRRDQWLKDRRGLGDIFSGMGATVLSGGFGEAWRQADLFGSRAAADAAKKHAEQAKDADWRESIDGPEAAWLLKRIPADGILDDNEKTLLKFIKANSTCIDPSLELLLEQAGL